jgi:20S proteasome alpha/beta subunit
MHIFSGGITLATVFYMKFNEEQGAMVADEMTWHLGFKYGYRPSRYGDSIRNLIDEEIAVKNNFISVYGGIGFPSFHEEVVRKSKGKIEQTMDYVGDLDKTADMVEGVFQEVHGRLISDKLRFYLGFNRDQLNNGKFAYNNEEHEIKQDAIINEAKKMIKNQDRTEAAHRIFDNESVIMGYDRDNGIRGYTFDNNGRNLDFAYPFGAIGTGQETGTKVFADIYYRMGLDERRKGFKFSDGLFILLNCFVESYDFNNKTGGYTQVFLMDARKEMFGGMTREINDHRGHLAAEIIRAYRWGYLKRETAQDMINRLLVQGENREEIEKELFRHSSDAEQLKKYLMGYKPLKAPISPLG